MQIQGCLVVWQPDVGWGGNVSYDVIIFWEFFGSLQAATGRKQEAPGYKSRRSLFCRSKGNRLNVVSGVHTSERRSSPLRARDLALIITFYLGVLETSTVSEAVKAVSPFVLHSFTR